MISPFLVVGRTWSRLVMSQMQYKSHSLVEISRSEWKTLLELYKHKPLEPNGYGLIKNYIKWVAEDEKVDAKIYSLDGEWQSDGTFVMIVCTQRECS